jgi:hypothetical protein
LVETLNVGVLAKLKAISPEPVEVGTTPVADPTSVPGLPALSERTSIVALAPRPTTPWHQIWKLVSETCWLTVKSLATQTFGLSD